MPKEMSTAGQALLDDVLTIKAGTPAKTWTPEQLLAISIRKQLKKSQVDFSTLLGVPVGTIRDWEQGRKQPGSAAITLIKVAQKHSALIEEVTKGVLQFEEGEISKRSVMDIFAQAKKKA